MPITTDNTYTVLVERFNTATIIGGPAGPKGDPGVSSDATILEMFRPSYTSGHPGIITRGMAVCLVDGLLRRATSIAPYNNVIGLLYEDSLAQGVTGRVQTGGNFTTTISMWEAATDMLGGLAPQQTYFLTETGAIRPFAPVSINNYVATVGLALNSTTIRIGFNASILL